MKKEHRGSLAFFGQAICNLGDTYYYKWTKLNIFFYKMLISFACRHLKSDEWVIVKFIEPAGWLLHRLSLLDFTLLNGHLKLIFQTTQYSRRGNTALYYTFSANGSGPSLRKPKSCASSPPLNALLALRPPWDCQCNLFFGFF